jgi:hypothetical protein
MGLLMLVLLLSSLMVGEVFIIHITHGLGDNLVVITRVILKKLLWAVLLLIVAFLLVLLL